MGRIVWITGASSGIGRAVALHLAAQGDRIAATSHEPEALELLVGEAPAGTIIAFPGDVTNAEAMAALVARIEGAMGPIDVAFLNAGGQKIENPACFDATLFADTVTLNLVGTANCVAAILPSMRGRRAGRVAINGSSAGYGGLPDALAYGASKAGLIHFAESLRLTEARHGIVVQLVTLGFVRTRLTAMNRFAMPFMVAPEHAAARIAAGLARDGFEIIVPRRLVWLLKILNFLPYRAYFALVAAGANRAQGRHGR